MRTRSLQIPQAAVRSPCAGYSSRMRKGFENKFPFIFKKRMSAVTTNSTRISKRFAELRASCKLGIVAYIVAGDPSLDASLKYVLALAEASADVIALGSASN